jgi:RNA binding exosome subunit
VSFQRADVKSTIQSLDVSYFLHATEDSDKVAAAVRGLVGGGTPFEFEMLEGHFGNSIRRVSLHLHGEDAMRAFTILIARMPGALRKSVAGDIDKLVDEHSSLYLRFDKQRLVQGEIAAGYDEAIRLKVKPRAFLMHGHARDFFLGQLKAK